MNVVVFAAQVWHGGLGSLTNMPGDTLLAFGGNYAGATVYEGRYETLLTSCFVHGSLLHIAFNMVALRQIGPFVERAVGVGRMAPLYVASGIVGSAGSTFFGWLSGGQRLGVGASGAICGLIGAALVIGYRLEGPKSPIMRMMGGWLLTILGLGLVVSFLIRLGGASGGFDNAAHAGGAISGAAIAVMWRRGRPYSKGLTTGILIACAALVAGAGVRCWRIDQSYPFATMLTSDRLNFAGSAIQAGQCGEARAAILSLHRLTAPGAEDVHNMTARYNARCCVTGDPRCVIRRD